MSDDWQQAPPEAEPVPSPTAQAPPSWREPLFAGLAAALAGALAWALITVLTHYKVGIVAVGLGFLVGGTVRKFGGAGSQPHAVLSAILALLGCALGNLLSACALIAVERSESILPVVLAVLGSPSLASQVMAATFSPMDLLFYAIAGYEGFKPVMR
jgi:hypothetical protein